MTIEEKWILDSFYSLWTGVPVTKIGLKGSTDRTRRSSR